MAILAFQKPDKVVMLEVNDRFGKFEFRPLEPGFGITIGNSLRRILLSSLEGYAINTIRIAGVEHEFSYSSWRKRRCYQHHFESQASSIQTSSRRIRERES